MSDLQIREWHCGDNDQLEAIMRMQLAEDLTWPPAYARELDIVEWLGTPANLGRWVCEYDDCVIGHIGLGSLDDGKAKHFCTATNCSQEQFAELCRTVVDPQKRSLGASALLTRTAIKAALAMNRIPVATVLTGRSTWLKMMLNTGWQQVGTSMIHNSDERLVSLLPPQKFVDAVVGYDH